jgi:hypothetical protein
VKKLLTAAICLLAGVALFLFYKSNQPAAPAGNPSVRETSVTQAPASADSRPKGVPTASAGTATGAGANTGSVPAASPAQPQDLSARAGQMVPVAPNSATNVPPQAAVQNIRRAVRQYGQMFGGDPVGNNPEITAELMGKNPKQINFLSAEDGMQINQSGELVDAWGTPYFFHQLSGSDMEVRSAGPDRKMWTSDDIVTR